MGGRMCVCMLESACDVGDLGAMWGKWRFDLDGEQHRSASDIIHTAQENQSAFT